MKKLTLFTLIFSCCLLFNCGKSTYTDDSIIYILNIKSFDRAQLSSLINRVSNADPNLTLLDLRFSNRKDQVADSLLAESLQGFKNPIVFTTSFSELYKDSGNDVFSGNNLLQTHAVFKDDPFIQGHTMTISEYIYDKPVMTSYPLKINYEDTISYHASLISAYLIDSLATAEFEQKNNNQIYLQLSQERIEQYHIVDLSFREYEKFDWNQLENKIVVFGYTGPTTEDKKYTKLNKNNFKSPDTYGVFLVIEIICEITKIN